MNAAQRSIADVVPDAVPAPGPAAVRAAPPPRPVTRDVPRAAARAAAAGVRGEEGGADAIGAAAARVAAAGRPWWFSIPGAMLSCARVALFPLDFVVRLVEAAVALALLAAFGLVAAWHFGYVSDKDVVAALKPVGQRVLAMVQSAGAP